MHYGQAQYDQAQHAQGRYDQRLYSQEPNAQGQYDQAQNAQGLYDRGQTSQEQASQGPRSTGSWPTAGPDQPPGWTPGAGPGQNFRDAGAWQAAGPGSEQGWANTGQDPFAGPPQAGTPQAGPPQAGPPQAGPPQAGPPQAGPPRPDQYPGQQPQNTGKLGDPHYGDDTGPGLRNAGPFATAGGPVITQRDSALPDQPPGGKGPIAALELDSVVAFARDLRVLRAQADLDYPDMAEKSHYTMRTLASAAGGLRLPTLPVLIAYVNACGGDVTEWEQRWGKLTESGKKSPVALPAAGFDSGGTPAAAAKIPAGPQPTGEIYVITSAKPRDDRW